MARFINLAGQTFGRLTVLSYAAGGRNGKWKCRCECGGSAVVATGALRNGHTKSCGCWKREQTSIRKRVHGGCAGGKREIEFKTWCQIRRRCLRPAHPAYPSYGGRGICICDRWLKGEGGRSGYECFRLDMGARPSVNHSIDRIDNDGNYEPGNCRWAIKKLQARNRRSNRIVEVGGKEMSLAAACDLLGANYALVNNRIQNGWTFERALSEPKQARYR